LLLCGGFELRNSDLWKSLGTLYTLIFAFSLAGCGTGDENAANYAGEGETCNKSADCEGELRCIEQVCAGADDTDTSTEIDADGGLSNEELSAPLFDPDEIIEVEIELASDDWDFIRTQTRDYGKLSDSCSAEPFFSPFVYRSGSVMVNGERLDNVGIRKKGFMGSLDDNKPSLKIKFDEYEEGQILHGLDRLTLNNNKSDPEHVSQCIAYRLFKKAGVPAPRCNFAHVTVNGQNLGLFTHLDSIKKRFIRHHFEDNEGNLYEGTLSDFFEGQETTFEAKTNKETPDRSDIAAVVEALALPDEELEEALASLVDIDEFMNFWAIEMLINHIDGYSNGKNNFYIYFDPTTNLMHFIPWGVDATFTHASKHGSNIVYAHGILARRLYMLPATQGRFIDVFQNILDNVWVEQEILAEIERMEALIAPVAADDYFNTPDNLPTEPIRDFINIKRSEIEPFLANPMIWEEAYNDPCKE
jgi:CotH kinase protein